MIRKREHYHSLYRSRLMDPLIFRPYRNYVSKCICQAKDNYYAHKFDIYKKDLKRTWSLINSVLRPGTNTKSKSIERLVIDGITYRDKVTMADKFNVHFSSVGRLIAESFDINSGLSRSYYLTGNYRNSFFFFSPVSPQYVVSVVCR